VRLSTGRWTSPSLGAAQPPLVHAGDNPDAPFGEDDDDDAYFDQFGYGQNYGDGSLQDDYTSGGGDDDYDIEAELGAGDARRNAIEWAVVLVGAVLLALILRAVLLQAFWIPSPSMESTLLVRDRVLVNKVSYNLHEIHRGDVIVFRRTEAEIAANPELPRDVIKRVIALEGETIEIRDNKVWINGGELLEPYLDEDVRTDDFEAETVPEGHVFVMGDNRGLSLDSRFETGPVSHDRVVGRAFFLFWPLDRLGSL
jgi:signal peptidase I